MSNHLPISRIKTIMKSSADVETISKESLHLVTVATELFIKHLAINSEKAANGKEIEYKHVAEVVNTSERYDFLTEIIPKKVTVREFKRMLKEKKNDSSDEETESSAASGSDSSESSSSSSDESDRNSSAHSSDHEEK